MVAVEVSLIVSVIVSSSVVVSSSGAVRAETGALGTAL
jgi:hypothetical protein